MPFRFDRLDFHHSDLAGDGTALRRRIAHLQRVDAPRLRRLWSYYRNPITLDAVASDSARPYRQAQEWGLPARITGRGETSRKEVVVENDIAWRIDAGVEFLFGQPLVINSAAHDASRRTRIERLLRRVLSQNGGVAFFQKLALLGAVYGYVDVLVKYVPAEPAPASASTECGTQALGEPSPTDDCDAPCDEDAPTGIRFEIVEPSRALPLLSSLDPTQPIAYAQHYTTARSACPAPPREWSWTDALKQALRAPVAPRRDEPADVSVLEIITPARWQRYENERLVAEGENSLGRLPLVHVQNASVPFEYAGASDVEPLVPLQDELNTRLSDRAYRITMQSFKMYLGRGIDDFDALPIGPGRMYSTDNPNASITEFGGDAACPSEQAHVDEIREALDKTSGVSPIAAGAIRGRIGNLTSAAALRVTLMAMLGRTERKRTTYGPAIAQLCELSLAWLDRAGVFHTTPEERRVEIHWPDAMPANESAALDEARQKQSLGIDADRVTRELGY